MTSEQYFQEFRQKHIVLLQAKIDRLREFKMNAFRQWEIPFDILYNQKIPFPWQNFPEIESLPQNASQPAVYYFSSGIECDKSLFDYFANAKIDSKSRKPGSYNISHVPKKFKSTNCIYAGSVSTGLHGRLISHLGLGNPGTGALYLLPILKFLPDRPSIFFNFQLLDYRDILIVEHIERIIQDSIDPLLGKKSLGRLDKECKSLGTEN